MAQSIFNQSIGISQEFVDRVVLEDEIRRDPHLHEQLCEMAHARYQVRQLLWKLVFATFLLMAIGSATRVMNAGLACPDWPLCYGTLIPTRQMNLQVFLEWIHRLDASLIGLMTIGLVGLSVWRRRHLPQWLLWTSGLALLLVCVQGALGALTVTALLRFDIVTAHLGTALCFFALLLGMAIALIPSTRNSQKNAQKNVQMSLLPSSVATCSQATVTPKAITPTTVVWLSAAMTVMVYVQSLSGGLVGSQWALHQCLAISQLCSVMNSHLLGVVPTVLGILALWGWIWKQRTQIDPLILRFIQLAVILLMLQVGLGIATFRLHLEVEPLTIAHQATGAALFGSLLCATVRSVLLRESSAT